MKRLSTSTIILLCVVAFLISCSTKLEQANQKMELKEYHDAYFLLEEIDSAHSDFTEAKTLMINIDHLLDSIKQVDHIAESLRVAKYQQSQLEKSTSNFTPFSSIALMFENGGDYETANGTLKILSNSPPVNVQVSQIVLVGDQTNVIIEMVKRDIVYVVFQTFAETNIEEITVTSIPLLVKNDIKTKIKYLTQHKKTVKINRGQAKKILEKYTGTSNFRTLYTHTSGMWLPNSKFDKLQYQQLNQLFDDL